MIIVLICQPVTQYFSNRLSEAVISELSAFFDDYQKKSEEKLKDFLLQLWFDAKFVLKVFSDRNQNSDATENLIITITQDFFGESSKRAAEVSRSLKDTLGWIARVDQLDKKIRGLMDPVDLLFYEKRIQQQTLLFFKSTHVLFGVICSGVAISESDSYVIQFYFH